MDAQKETLVDAQADIEGTLKGRDAQILGRFKGEVEVSGRLVLGQASRVEAKVRAQAVEVGGEFRGDIRAESVTLTETARFTGRLDAERLAMRDGASLDGEVGVGRGTASP